MTPTTNQAEQGPRRRAVRRTLFGAALAFGLAALTPLTADAAAVQSASYGNLPNEGLYSPGCGSFARVENAPRDCAAHSNRLDGSKIVWVLETVDPGINYAYTKVINNLNGRQSRAVLICDNRTVASTAWYKTAP